VTSASLQTAGVAFSFTVTARDVFNNVATGYAGTVHITSTDGAAVLPANSTLTSGVKTFVSGATLKTAGSQTITATDTVTAGITGTSSSITVTPAAAATLSVTGFPSPHTHGVSGSFNVTARDPFGNTATGYSGTGAFHVERFFGRFAVKFGPDIWVGSFNATLNSIGTQSITAVDTVNAGITGTQSGIIIN